MNYAKQDLGISPKDLNGEQIVEFLDRRISETIEEVKTTKLWETLTSKQTDPELVKDIMKEIYQEVVMYQPDVIEATIAIIAQFPRTMPVKYIDEMLHHQVEEFDHGEMALRDYIGLGGDEAEARSRKHSPTAFNVAAMWRHLCHKRDPFAYLGALYPFEGLTPIISEMIKPYLKAKGMSKRSTEFVDYHSTADLEHTVLVKELIKNIADEYPESKESICYGINYFLSVYPLPGWKAAFSRALSRHQNLLV